MPPQQNETSAATNYWNKFRHIESWESLVIGDVNGDLEVNLADVNDIINVILGVDNGTAAADVNAVIDIIMSGI